MHGVIKSVDEAAHYNEQFHELVTSDKRDGRVSISEIRIEAFNHAQMQNVNFTKNCLIVDFAHLYSHSKTQLGVVIPVVHYHNQESWSKDPIKINVLRFGYPKDHLFDYISSHCKLFNVNPDGSITTFVDILRLMKISFNENEPIDYIINMINTGVNSISIIYSNVIEKLSGKKFYEISDFLEEMKKNYSDICTIFDMLFDSISINNIKYEYLKIFLKNTYDLYKDLVKRVPYTDAIAMLTTIFKDKGIELGVQPPAIVGHMSDQSPDVGHMSDQSPDVDHMAVPLLGNVTDNIESLNPEQKELYTSIMSQGIFSSEDALSFIIHNKQKYINKLINSF